MRRTRWIVLAIIAALMAGVGLTYRARRIAQEKAPGVAAPPSLPLGLNASAEDWQWSQTEDGRPVVSVRAKNLRQQADSSRLELEGVELRLYHKRDNQFDLVKCASAEFRQKEGLLYTEGAVEITLAVPAEGEPKRQLVKIESSGVTFESKTGKATTDRPATFYFENGSGTSVGASYDPTLRELHLRGQPKLHWQPAGRQAMTMESGELIYKETLSVVLMFPWSKLTREQSTIEAADSVAILKEGVIERVESKQAKGVDVRQKRRLEYSAEQLTAEFAGQGQVRHVTGERNARLVSNSTTAKTVVSTNRVDLDFVIESKESELSRALATGKSVVVSEPAPGAPAGDTRTLSSEVIEMKMRPGGEEMETVVTHSPGTFEIVPGRPGGRRRQMQGERISMTYGPENRLDKMRSTNVRTVTFPLAAKSGKPLPPANTSSRNLTAEFDPKTGQVARLEQWEDFQYDEGDRRAKALRATLDQAKNVITLDTGARMWDESSSTSADQIVLDQASGDFQAIGNVSSSRLPERAAAKPEAKKPDPAAGAAKQPSLLADDQPMQAQADKLDSKKRNSLLLYSGHAVVWQGGNRMRADSVLIDREKKTLSASGNVNSQFLDNKKQTAGAPKTQQQFTTVTAQSMTYNDQERLAHYRGGVLMRRPGMDVKADELRAILADRDAESSIEKAFADGKVEIYSQSPDRNRVGTGEKAIYDTAAETVILRGGSPRFTDSLKGTTQGDELTWYSGEDKLLVTGVQSKPAASRIRRK